MSGLCQIEPLVRKLWPPQGDNRVTNMDVVFFGDLEEGRTAVDWLFDEFEEGGSAVEWLFGELEEGHAAVEEGGAAVEWLFDDLEEEGAAVEWHGETWVQKGHPEVYWPQQWLPEDLGRNVRIFEILHLYYPWPKRVRDHSVEEAALQQLDTVTRLSLLDFCWEIRKQNKDGQGCPLVFVGHGYGAWVLKQALVELHARLEFKALQRNLRGIVFYHATNTEPTNKHGLNAARLQYTLLLLELSKRFEVALDLKKVKVCVVNKNESHLEEIRDYADLEHMFKSMVDMDDACTPTSKEDPRYYILLEFLQQFLPKGLHQIIDDKKGQEVQLVLSETKDKKALGDVEIASTSITENRDKEMDQLQCFVTHVDNVDQDGDLLLGEAYKLQAYLHQKMEWLKAMEVQQSFQTFMNFIQNF